ncbi:Cupredoxin-like domain protein [uncultured archaeon]|nr:Cupredoxin-like domain protein [uncultured archaeon]
MWNFGFLTRWGGILVAKSWLLYLILLSVLFSGCADKKTGQTVMETGQAPEESVSPTFTVAEPTTVYVEIFGSAFNPQELKITRGTTVRWTNKDSAVHTVKGEGFSSPPLNKREMWKYTFNKTGTFEYSCSDQYSMQHGRIIVD